MSEKNLKGKSRKVEDPYAVYKLGDWEWRVLKHYQAPDKEKENPYARVFCAVRSPMTYGSWEYGDVYISDIPGMDPGRKNPIDDILPRTL